MTSKSLGLQDKLKNLYGRTIHLKIVAPTNRTKGTRVGTGWSRVGTVGTTRGGTGSTSTGSTPKVRRWEWRRPINRLQNLQSQITELIQSK